MKYTGVDPTVGPINLKVLRDLIEVRDLIRSGLTMSALTMLENKLDEYMPSKEWIKHARFKDRM